MPRVIVVGEHPDEPVTLDEHVEPHDFDSEHFGHCLLERIAWATADAEAEESGGGQPAASPS